MIRTTAAGAMLGLALALGVGAAASGAVLVSDAEGVSTDSVEASLRETPASGMTLAGTGVGFLLLGAGAVSVAQRRRWGSDGTSTDMTAPEADSPC